MKTLFLTGILCLASAAFAETKYTTAQYVAQWKATAIEQMIEHKIPASITLAQGILESANGNSKLAVQAKNHFGIKCHSTWKGATFIQDDDKKDECFRSYNSAKESYNDHSLFLTGRKRYAGLFELKLHDYKGWAKGLKSAGYATNPKYAYLLIDIIERFDLDQYDRVNSRNELSVKKKAASPKIKVVKPTHQTKPKTTHTTQNTAKSTNETNHLIKIKAGNHQVLLNKNKVKYILVKEGDTFFRIANEFQVTVNQLYRYNEFANKDVLEPGDIIYVTPKRARAQRGNEKYICSTNTTLREIAHQEGIKLSSLMKLNLSENPDALLKKGSKVILR